MLKDDGDDGDDDDDDEDVDDDDDEDDDDDDDDDNDDDDDYDDDDERVSDCFDNVSLPVFHHHPLGRNWSLASLSCDTNIEQKKETNMFNHI